MSYYVIRRKEDGAMKSSDRHWVRRRWLGPPRLYTSAGTARAAVTSLVRPPTTRDMFEIVEVHLNELGTISTETKRLANVR